MKKKCWIAGLLAIAVLVGCSRDDLNGGHNGHDRDALVYMNVAVQLPGGSGASVCSGTDSGADDDYVTSDSGQEIGKDYENKVTNILLVLADRNNKFIAYGEQDSYQEIKSGKVSTTQKIDKSTLSDFYNGRTLTEAERSVLVYTFCNPTADLKSKIVNAGADEVSKNNWYNAVCQISETADGTVENGAIWGGADHQQGFLMATASATRALKTIPATFEDWNSYTSVDKAFNLSGINNANSDKEIDNRGDIPVERVVARFDFKDGSGNNNTYDVIKSGDEGGGATVMQIQLQKMALVNMSKVFYYLRRVSDDGLNDNAVICGTEISENYVVDADAADKQSDAIISTNAYDKYFNFCLGHVNSQGEWGIDAIARNQWYTSDINAVLRQGSDDNDNDWNTDQAHGNYKIWRYVTENTIPGIVQKNGVTTGIVFKGKMIATADASGSLADALNQVTGSADDAILYAYSNNLYVTWVEVRTAALQAGVDSEFYRSVFGNPGNVPEAGDSPVYSDDDNSADFKWNAWRNESIEDDEALSAFRRAATTAKFTIYQSSVDEDYGAGYYCYYFYWNRHNDNDNDGVMAPMEFAVVRNNVYKLAVTKIDRLGHPRITENDPDPVDPDEPDEKGDLYLSMSVEVLPWVVRENNIDF